LGKPIVAESRAACWRLGLTPLAAVLAAFLAVNLFTAARSPIVLTDEVFFADPAVNFIQGRGFTSTAWSQPGNEFFAENVPLHSWLLIPWIRAFGVNPTSVRSINYVLMAAAAVVLWIATARSALVKSPRWRLAAITAILLSYEVTFSYRSGRYDVLGILLFSLLFAAYTARRPALRLAAALFVGILLPMAGLQLVVLAAILGLTLLAFLPARALSFVAMTFAGIAAGLGALILLYMHFGVLGHFLHTALKLSATPRQPGHVTLSNILRQKLATEITGWIKPTFLLLLPVLAGLFWAQRRTSPRNWRTPAAFGIVCGILVPLISSLAYDLPVYYGWMVAVPAILAAVATVDQWEPGRLRTRAAWATGIALALAAAIGLPFRLFVTAAQWPDRDYAPVEEFVLHNLSGDDHVAADYGAYYPVKEKAAECFLARNLPVMSNAEKSRVNVLVIDTGNLDAFAGLGETWTPVAAMATSNAPPFLAFLHNPSDRTAYHLTIYRRTRRR
jgi:hypothetical protein